MKLRSFIFWPHLIAGVTAGTVILVMCVTGVLLTYERQLVAWADSGYRSAPPAPGAQPLTMEDLGLICDREISKSPRSKTDNQSKIRNPKSIPNPQSKIQNVTASGRARGRRAAPDTA